MSHKLISRIKSGAGLTNRAAVPHLTNIIAWEGRLEEAAQLLAQTLAAKPRKGKKPVLIHSLRVAYRLIALGCCRDVVVAGLLHDLLEKASQAMHRQVAQRFGLEVAHMVQATTNDPSIREPLRRYADSVRRCSIYGEGALLVRGADLLDNCERALALTGGVKLARLAGKLRILIAAGKELQIDRKMLDQLQRCLRRVVRKISLGPAHK